MLARWHAILKPCDDVKEWRWMGRVMSALKQDGFRVSVPIMANNGELVVDGDDTGFSK